MNNRFGKGIAAIMLCITMLFLAPGCGAPDKRITTGAVTLKQGLDVSDRNTDRIWTAFITQYRADEMAKIDGYFAADEKKALANKPVRSTFANSDDYAEALIQYASDSTIFLRQSEAIKKRNINKLNDRIAAAQTTYDATKRNRQAYAELAQTLAEYEDAKIDPTAVAPIIQQLVTAFIPQKK